MKLFVATDVHGSAYWAQKTVEKFLASQADNLVLLGDVYNHGPRNPFPRDYAPMRVAELFGSVADKVIAVTGNCDSEVDGMISAFPFVRDCVIPFARHRLYLTHGHVYNKTALPKLSNGDALIYGHFHVNEHVLVNGVHCIALSSVALPKDRGAYCIAQDGRIELFDFDDKPIFAVNLDE